MSGVSKPEWNSVHSRVSGNPEQDNKSIHVSPGSPLSRGRTVSVGRLMPGQLALAAGVFAVIPFNELAVLHHVLGDDRHGVLAVIVEGDLPHDRIAIFHVRQRSNHLAAVGPDLLDGV